MNNGKIRIYELSKELNLENRDILAACEQLGIAVKSHSSTISGEEAERIRAQAPKISAHRSSNRSPDRKTSKSSVKPKPKAKPAVKQQQILEIRRSEPAATPIEHQAEPEEPLAVPPTATPPTATPPAAQKPQRPAGSESVEMSRPVPPVETAPMRAAPAGHRAEGSSAENGSREAARPPAAASAVSPVRPVAPTRPTPPSRPASPPKGTSADASNPESGGSPAEVAEKPTASAANPPASQPSPRPSPPRPGGASRPRPSLASPPSRPSRSGPGSADVGSGAESGAGSGAGSDPGPTGTGSASPRPRPRIVAQATSSEEDGAGTGRPTSERPRPSRPVVGGPRRTAKPSRDGGDRNAPRSTSPQIVQLKRPELAAPPSRPAATSAKTQDDDGDFDTSDNVSGLPELERPRRPAPPSRPSRRGAPTRSREEFEDGENRKKTANRPKKKIHIIGDDDDDLLDGSLSGSSELSGAMSVSLARPPKPKSMQSTTTASKPASSPSRRRPSKGGRGGSRREDNRHNKAEKPQRPEFIILKKGSMTVQELSRVLITPETDIIRTLFFKGIAATITQTLDDSTIALVCKELEVEVEFEGEESRAIKGDDYMVSQEDMEHLETRPPVVTIMGHVDHGKTTLLDSIRKTKVAAGEAGGITQHIGAYHVDVTHNDVEQQIVFLDTPGHEAFTAMRARGTRVTDIAILVVAADDGVRPQTLEAISHAKAAKVPLIVAINKIDKEGAQPDRVKQELTDQGLVPEEWGGDTMMVPVSALNGDNLDQLLENILLVSEVAELSANPDRPAKGTVIEANLDKARGPVATLLVQNGTLRVGDVLVAGSVFGRVRAMVGDRGDRVDTASPSFAVEVLGLNEVPRAGDEFDVYLDEKEARSVASERANAQRDSRLLQAAKSTVVTLNSLSARAQEGQLKELNLIIKSDVQGSLEAITKSLNELPQDEVQVRILLASPGEITETDVDLAAASGAVILGFNTALASGAKRAADEAGVDVREYDIIYQLLEEVQGAMEGLLDPEMVEEPLGQLEVRAVFTVGRNAVAGCYVQSGKALRNCKIRVHRGSQKVYEGDLDSLRRVRDDVKEVNAGYECGIGVDRFNDWKEGDIIETFKMVSKRRTLNI